MRLEMFDVSAHLPWLFSFGRVSLARVEYAYMGLHVTSHGNGSWVVGVQDCKGHSFRSHPKPTTNSNNTNSIQFKQSLANNNWIRNLPRQTKHCPPVLLRSLPGVSLQSGLRASLTARICLSNMHQQWCSEELTRLAETRLAQKTVNYSYIVWIALT